MNLQYYYNYVTIVEEGSLTAAAKKLHIAQPALSNQIKAMEQRYGTRLFFRGARRLELTDAGMILYQKAKGICEMEQAAQNQIISGFSGQQGTLRVGVTPSVAGGKITDVLLDFAQRYPKIEIKYLEAGAGDLYKMLQNGIIEVAVVKTMDQIPDNVQLLASENAPTVAVYKPGAGLLDTVRGEKVSLTALSGAPIAMEELYQRQVAAAFKAANADLNLKALNSSPYVGVRMARAGLAVALVSARVAAGAEAEGLAMKAIGGGEALAARYCLLAQRGNYRSQVVNNFLALLSDAFGLDLGDALPAPAEQAEA